MADQAGFKGRVLAVDDEEHITEVIKLHLENRGYEVFTANSGEEGIEVFQAKKPQVIVLDIMMPGMNGLDVLKKVAQLDPAVDVIMLTALDDTMLALEAIRLGAYGYVTKPINMGRLEELIAEKIEAN